MKVGELVTIYYMSHIGLDHLVDTTGLITAKHGYKCSVLIDGELEVWHEQDLVKMEQEKNGN